jgi:hypothetical protein
MSPNEISRTPPNEQHRAAGESLLAWMRRNQSTARIGRAHDVLNKLLDVFPAAARRDVESRLASNDDRQFRGAFFELYLYAVLRAVPGLTRLDVAPSSSRSKPDFRVGYGPDRFCHIEATSFDLPEFDHDTTSYIDRLFRDVAPFIDVPGYRVMVESFNRGASEPARRRLARQLNNWFRSLDRAALLALGPRGSAPPLECLPSLLLRDEPSGWQFELRVLPITAENVIPDRLAATIGACEVVHIDHAARLRAICERKRRQHRDLNEPVVIAVTNNDWPGEPKDDDVLDALLGTSVYVVPKRGEGDGQWRRRPDGLWQNPWQKKTSSPPCSLPRCASLGTFHRPT